MGVWGALLQGVMSVNSGVEQGIEDKKEADRNTALANEAADDALRRGTAEAGKVRQAGSQLQARQFLAFSNSGVDATVGTAADVQADAASQTELSALEVENNAAREAWGYKKGGMAFQTQAAINSTRRNREMTGSIIGSAGNAMSQYSDKGLGFGKKGE